jgi:hypothetical protein
MGGAARHRLGVALAALSLLGLSAGAATAAASGGAQAFQPRAGHVGVVVTAGEVFVSWNKPAGAGKISVRRSESACPRTPADGSVAGEVTPLHVIDRSVKAGTAYCYTVFRTDAGGVVTTVGSTGLLTVPDSGSVPPAHVSPPAAAPTVTVSRISPALVHKLEIGAAAAFAAMLIVVIAVRSARRVAAGRMVLRPTMRESLVSRNSSALVVPAMIALGWVGIVVAFVVLR